MAFSVVLFDNYPERDNLLPLVATRPVGNLRVGILTIDEKWKLLFKKDVSYITVSYLRVKYSFSSVTTEESVIINSAFLPNSNLRDVISELRNGQCLVSTAGDWIAVKITDVSDFDITKVLNLDCVSYQGEVCKLHYPEDVFVYNASQISLDLHLFDASSFLEVETLDAEVVGKEVYVERGVVLSKAILDTSKGPIYIGKNTMLEPGVVVNGPAAIGDNCRLKSGTVIYPNVTIGDNSVICGELNNSVIWGNSAKGHYGYLGCAVVGEGCNLGAGTTNSNLKNDWSSVKLYDYGMGGYRDTGLFKCGVVIGDQAMFAIQSKITTGTVIGVGAQVAMSKFIPKFVPDFTWITDDKNETYIYTRFEQMMQRKSDLKGELLKNEDLEILKNVFLKTEKLRKNNQH